MQRVLCKVSGAQKQACICRRMQVQVYPILDAKFSLNGEWNKLINEEIFENDMNQQRKGLAWYLKEHDSTLLKNSQLSAE